MGAGRLSWMNHATTFETFGRFRVGAGGVRSRIEKPFDAAAPRADIVARRSVKPVQVEKRHPSGVEKPIAAKEEILSAVRAAELAAGN
jgi:hypothetical protein